MGAWNFWGQFSWVTQSCPTLCNPMDWSTADFCVHHQLLELGQIRCPLSWWCHPTILSSVVPFSSFLQSCPALGSFPMSPFFIAGGQSIGVSTSASVLPMNIQDWYSLGLTGWISLLSKGLSRVFSNTTVRKPDLIPWIYFSLPLYNRKGFDLGHTWMV